jgi:Cu(I)/Ag(I) efflux system membrane fusion protein
MKKSHAIILVATFALGAYFLIRGRQADESVSNVSAINLQKNSPRFNESLDRAVDDYIKIKDAFVEGDTVAVKRHAALFLVNLDSIPLEELRADSTQVFQSAMVMRDDIKANIVSMLSQTALSEMRKDFSMAGDLIYPGFLKLVNYQGARIYLQHCPMAFGEEKGANWISKENKIMNPYLGKSDPTYGAGMLHCGEVKDSMGGK